MSNIQFVAPRILGAAAAPQEDPKPADAADGTETYTPTPEEVAFAKAHPAGQIHVERSGLKLAARITGGTLGLGGAALLGISLLSRGGAGAGASRLLAGPLIAGGGLVALGAGAAIGAELIKPRQEIAVATNFPTRGDAQQFANKMVGRVAEVVQDEGGKWAVLDRGPVQGTYGYQSGGGSYYGGNGYHGYHYYGDGHNHAYGYYEPYYPGHYNHGYYPDYDWGSSYDPWDTYPRPTGGYTSPGDDYYPDTGGGYSGGSTSPGDDYPSSGGGYNSGGSTSSGDDYPSSGGSSYDPPSYDPPSYDPPSYDPPSYDPPSYDPPSYDPPSYDPPSYDPPSYGGGSDYGSGNSSSNGNPSYDDF
jgi:hypothetical protein